MMNEGERILFRLHTIRKAVISHSEPLMWYSKKRVELELLTLKYWNISEDKNSVGNTWDIVVEKAVEQAVEQAVDMHRIDILRQIQHRMHWERSRVCDLINEHDMMII
ncbi:hypothetical protein DPMN_038576 [Dreissena polymorpha]|uniref:Uncharacterized protein n=1 Tax=Dreissena polymorpha TaxID=45954 RepID=A0A9D4MEH2_DREPO|nr:hypothetical protein DPMN_038576 [Dreissena polymorpha]